MAVEMVIANTSKVPISQKHVYEPEQTSVDVWSSSYLRPSMEIFYTDRSITKCY